MGVLRLTLGRRRPGQLLSVATRAQGPPEGCPQPVYSSWNNPNPDCIIATVLLSVLFFPAGATHTWRGSEGPVAPLLPPRNPGRRSLGKGCDQRRDSAETGRNLVAGRPHPG